MQTQEIAKKGSLLFVLYVIADNLSKTLTAEHLAKLYFILTTTPLKYLLAVLVVSLGLTMFVLFVFFLIWIYNNVIK